MENQHNTDTIVEATANASVIRAAERLVHAQERAIRTRIKDRDYSAFRVVADALSQGVLPGQLIIHFNEAVAGVEARAAATAHYVGATLGTVRTRCAELEAHDSALGYAMTVIAAEAKRLEAASAQITVPDAHEFLSLIQGGFSADQAREVIAQTHERREAEKRQALRRAFNLADDDPLPPVQTDVERAAAALDEAKQLRAVGDSLQNVRADPLRRMDSLPALLRDLIKTMPAHYPPQDLLAQIKAATR